MVIDIEAACRGRCLKSAMRKESEVVASKSDRIDVEARTSLFTPFHPLPPHSTPFYPILYSSPHISFKQSKSVSSRHQVG